MSLPVSTINSYTTRLMPKQTYRTATQPFFIPDNDQGGGGGGGGGGVQSFDTINVSTINVAGQGNINLGAFADITGQFSLLTVENIDCLGMGSFISSFTNVNQNGYLESLNLSVLNRADFNNTELINVSSINGLVYPPPGSGQIQTSSNNPSQLSGYSLAPGAFVPLVSTPTLFNFVSGKTYDICLPVGINVSSAPADAPANIYLGAKVQSDTQYTTGTVIHTQPGQTQTVDYTPIRWIRTAPATESVPLVFGAYIQNASSNATISAGIASSAQDLQFVGQLN